MLLLWYNIYMKTYRSVMLCAVTFLFAIALLFTNTSSVSAQFASTPNLKPEIIGLMDRGMDDPSQPWSAPDPTNQSYLGQPITGYAVNVGWNELQPTKNGPIASNTRLDKALAQVRAFNTSNPTTPLHLRLRVFAGVNSPSWAMNLDGTAMTLDCYDIPIPFSCFGGPEGSTPLPPDPTVKVPRFWGPNYMAAYKQLLNKLSTKYDSAPEIVEIDISGCSTMYPEPFLKQFGLGNNKKTYLTAGWTQSKDVTCQKANFNDFLSAWPTTSVGVALNPYDTINSTGQFAQSDSVTYSLMQYCRNQLGNRCVLENYSTRTPALAGTYTQMYSEMTALGPPIAYQTAIDSRVGNLDTTLCSDMTSGKAIDIELARGYDDPSNPYGIYRTPAQLMPYSKSMAPQGSAACP